MMNTIFLLLLISTACFSSPVVRPYRFRNARIDGPRAGEPYGLPADSENEQSGPYPPSGWTPSGDLLLVPGETHSSQQNGYPAAVPPNNQYGPVETTTTELPATTTEQPNEEPDASDGNSQVENPYAENGQYYVLLPGGKLQRVQYSGKQRGRGQYEAQVQYEEVDPVRSPVFAYPNFPVPLPL